MARLISFPNVSLRLIAAQVVSVAVLTLLVAGSSAKATVVRFATVMGNVDVRLYDKATPLSVQNFLGYVNRGDYNNTMIHRSVTDFVIQGGGWKYNGTQQTEPQDFPLITAQAPVTNEPGISNLAGTLAYAKVGPPSGQQPTPQTINSATKEWFFNLKDNSSNLNNQNGGFTVFGRVLGNGMNVVNAIAALPKYEFLGAWSDAPMRNYSQAQWENYVPIDGDNVVSLTVSVLNFKAGDYDFNGTVNAADYTVWRNSFGSTTDAAADGNGNGVVDMADFVLWRDTLGQSGGPSAGAGSLVTGEVPEPTSLILAAVGGVLLSGFWRRRKHVKSGSVLRKIALAFRRWIRKNSAVCRAVLNSCEFSYGRKPAAMELRR